MDSTLIERIKDRQKLLKHKITLSRRSLLEQGFYACMGGVLAPSPLAAFVRATDRRADAAASAAIPFLCFDMAGGAALAGNALVGGEGGPDDLLKSYSTLGWDPNQLGSNIDRRFGLPMAASVSGLFKGMVSTMSAEAQSHLRLGSVCHFSRLDTNANPQNIAPLVAAFGSKGSVFPGVLGTSYGPSGGHSAVALDQAYPKPVYFDNVDNLKSSLSFGGVALASIGQENLGRLAQANRELSAEQLETLRSGPGGSLLVERFEAFLNEPAVSDLGLDPRADPTAKSVWGFSGSESAQASEVIQASVAMSVINGVSGPGVWTLGGCDYHIGSNDVGDAKDEEMGTAIGRSVEYAHQTGRPLFFQLISDGSCAAGGGTRNWATDTNEGMQIFGFYNPDAVPSYTNPNMQIGHFNDSQAAERTTKVGADPRLGALAVLANYCNVQGRLGEFFDITQIFRREEIDSLIVMAER